MIVCTGLTFIVFYLADKNDEPETCNVSRILEALAIERKPLSIFMHHEVVSIYTDNL